MVYVRSRCTDFVSRTRGTSPRHGTSLKESAHWGNLTEQREEIVETLRRRVLRGIESGTLRVGDRLPSGRDLVAEFQVDHRVILSAYRTLADEGWVEMRERGGVYVASRNGASGLPPLPQQWFVDVLTEGLAREIPAPHLHEWLRRCTDTLRLRAVAVASTLDQAQGLCRELHDDFGFEAEGLLAAELSDGSMPPLALRRADLIVTTGAHAETMHRIGEELGKPVTVIEVRPDLVTGEWALLLRQPVYAVVATPAFGEMLRAFFRDIPGVENLHIVVFGRDEISSIPANAPTYVTQGVRAKLGGVELPGRILPAVRTVSTRSAREIFSFIVQANIGAMSRLTH